MSQAHLRAATDKINNLPRQPDFIPGEQDTSIDDGKMYMQRYGRNAKGRGWHSFTRKDVHFIGLSNVEALEWPGKLGPDQIPWLEAENRISAG